MYNNLTMMYRKYNNGIIEVITGPMFAGKSEELIRRVRLMGFANEKVLVVKPSIDTRWDHDKITSRSGRSIETIVVEKADEIITAFNQNTYAVVAIDEAQFFGNNIIDVAVGLADKGVRVIISTLDTDFERKPFIPSPNLLAVAENVTKLAAVCFRCAKAATFTYRKTKSTETIVVGNDEYEARCRKCHIYGTIEKTQEIKVG